MQLNQSETKRISAHFEAFLLLADNILGGDEGARPKPLSENENENSEVDYCWWLFSDDTSSTFFGQIQLSVKSALKSQLSQECLIDKGYWKNHLAVRKDMKSILTRTIAA